MNTVRLRWLAALGFLVGACATTTPPPESWGGLISTDLIVEAAEVGNQVTVSPRWASGSVLRGILAGGGESRSGNVPSALDLGMASARELSARIQRAAGSSEPFCSRRAPASEKPLEQLVAKAANVLEGQLTWVNVGLSLGEASPVVETLVQIGSVTVRRGQALNRQEEDLLVLVPGGELVVNDMRLCSARPQEMAHLLVGSRVIFGPLSKTRKSVLDHPTFLLVEVPGGWLPLVGRSVEGEIVSRAELDPLLGGSKAGSP